MLHAEAVGAALTLHNASRANKACHLVVSVEGFLRDRLACARYSNFTCSFPPGIPMQLLDATLKATTRH